MYHPYLSIYTSVCLSILLSLSHALLCRIRTQSMAHEMHRGVLPDNAGDRGSTPNTEAVGGIAAWDQVRAIKVACLCLSLSKPAVAAVATLGFSQIQRHVRASKTLQPPALFSTLQRCASSLSPETSPTTLAHPTTSIISVDVYKVPAQGQRFQI